MTPNETSITTRQIAQALNKAMKANGMFSKWKVSVIGTFIAVVAKADVKVSEAYAAKRFIEANFPSIIGSNMIPVIAPSSFEDNTTVINFSRN